MCAKKTAGGDSGAAEKKAKKEGKGAKDEGKTKEAKTEVKESKSKGGKDDSKGKGGKEEAPPSKGKGGKDDAKNKGGSKEDATQAKGGKGKDDAPAGKGKGGKDESTTKSKAKVVEEEPFVEVEPEKTDSEIARENAKLRASLRKQMFRKKWPDVTKVHLKTVPWKPPGPPEKAPKVIINLPDLTLKPWVPPFMRRRRKRPKLLRIPAEEMTQPLTENSKLRKIWHGFQKVDRNKMLLQGTSSCNNKQYSPNTCGAQTGCIAVICRALLDEKKPSELTKQDVDEVIEAGDKFYQQCRHALKCYKGKPSLHLKQLKTDFYFHDTKYTVQFSEVDSGVLAKSPDNVQAAADLMALMEKQSGSDYMLILSVGNEKHFLVWGHPPSEAAPVKTICYMFDPHMLNDQGQPEAGPLVCCNISKFNGGGFLRYPGVSSFVMDFLANYGNLNAANRTKPRPPITLTKCEIVQKEPINREVRYMIDLKTFKPHCRGEWEALHYNTLLDRKIKDGEYPLASLSAVSLATSRSRSKKKMVEFYQKIPKEQPPVLPVPPDKGLPAPTNEQILELRGEDFFLYCPQADGHTYGRDDNIPLPKEEAVVHSLVEVQDKNYRSQFKQLDVDKWILRATRHMAVLKYYTFKYYTGVACCVSALAMLQRLKARGWNEDTLDETLDCGWNYFRESLEERKGPIRRLVLGELKDTLKIRDKEYKQKSTGISVWGKLISSDPKVFDICRGLEKFFKQSDTGILQVPGEYETAIWNEGGKYYVYQPWPANKHGMRVSLQGGGKACLLYFTKVSRLCEHFLDCLSDMKRKPFSISEVVIRDLGLRAPPVNNMKPVAPARWVVRGGFHEGDERFPENHRNKQATPMAIAAIAMASIVDPAEWTPADIEETLNRGDILYEKTMEHLEKLGINFDTPAPGENEEGAPEDEEVATVGPSGTMAAADVLPRFKISEYDCIETEVADSAYSGSLSGDQTTGLMSLKDSLRELFKKNNAGVLTARGGSVAVFKHKDHLYMFDPHGCDENGLPSEERLSGAALIRMKNNVKELADVIMGNLPAGSDDSFNLSPVEITVSKLNAEIGAPEMKIENKAFDWMNRGTATILNGPRGENSAIGKAAKKAGIGADDLAGRTLALPAAAAFCAASASVPPPHMHQDHMFNLLEAGGEYYLNHVKKTGRKDIKVEDLTEKFEMGANTFSIELEEPIRMPLRLPDQVEEGEGGGMDAGEGVPEQVDREMKDILTKMWYDTTKPNTISLLVGDYHQLGLWMAPEGKVVAFDPAPTLHRGLLTPQRIAKGDELRLQRLKEEAPDEGGEEADDEEVGGEGEEQPEPAPEFVPPESCPVLMIFSTPGEFIDRLTQKAGLDPKQAVAPYWLYPVKVTNELTSLLKEKRPGTKGKGEGDEGEVEEEEVLIEPLDDAVLGKYFERMSRSVASVRGRVAQNENYFMDTPNRDNQDAANSVMGIVVNHIEPYVSWKAPLIDAVLKYGDRLHTLSLPNAGNPPKLDVDEVEKEFHVTSFNVKLEVEPDVVTGDVKAGESGGVLSLVKGIKKFFETNNDGVICAKGYCVGIWKINDTAYCLWEPHAVGPTGKSSTGGSAGLVMFSTIEELADTIKYNVDQLNKPGTNKYTISAVKVFWEVAKPGIGMTPQGAVPDELYEWKVLTAFVEVGSGRTILRGGRPCDLARFTRDSVIQSAPTAIVAGCMAFVRRPHLWTHKTVDEIMNNGCLLFTAAINNLGYEFRPGEDVLLPLQVPKRFTLGSNYVRYSLDAVFTGRLEQREATEMSVRAALEKFFKNHTHGILWSTPYAVAVWRVSGAPPYYMMEPHACGTTGLRLDGQDNGAPCVLTFTSPKLMAFTYLQNIPALERPRHEFTIYNLAVDVDPIKELDEDPPLLKTNLGPNVVPATSRADIHGNKRRADERDRKHPPGRETCTDAQRASEARDKTLSKYKGIRNTSGWLVLMDGSAFLSAGHSMACKRFPYGSRGNQALANSVMAVAMSRVEEVCRWCNTTLDQILDSGDQLYQDSYLHYRPKGTKILTIEQILRKFYTPGNCVCRVKVYQARQQGTVPDNLVDQLSEFFREEKAGVFVAGKGDFAVALFRSPRGYYMFDPSDRDRYGRAVAPPCKGRARACLSQFPNVKALADKLSPNIPPVLVPKRSAPRNVEYYLQKISEMLSGNSKIHKKEGATVQDVTNLANKLGVQIPPVTEENAAQLMGLLLADQAEFADMDEEDMEMEEQKASFKIYGMSVSTLRRMNRHEK